MFSALLGHRWLRDRNYYPSRGSAMKKHIEKTLLLEGKCNTGFSFQRTKPILLRYNVDVQKNGTLQLEPARRKQRQ